MDLDFEYTFGDGRTLKFIHTPYSHSPGSFITYDIKTKTLFQVIFWVALIMNGDYLIL